MARRKPYVEPEAGELPVPTQAVEDPILSSPYEEPRSHWIYDKGVPKESLGRRPAGYFYKTERTGSAQADLFAEEQRDDLPLVNALRADVGRWRSSGYRGASEVTKDLLRHWTDARRSRRLFFCQIEAVETLIYLLELRIPGRSARTGFRDFELTDSDLALLLKGQPPRTLGIRDTSTAPSLCDQPADPMWRSLARLGCKMATGSGKTIVMAMTVAWAFCNRGRNPASTEFPNAVLVVAPNLTVKNRLAVLKPEDSSNYYAAFDIVPSKYREYLQRGKVLVTNWHVFGLKSPGSEGGTTYRVVDKGEEDARAFTLSRLGELAQRMPILVLNDEAHHCWRPRIGTDEDALEAGDTREEQRQFQDELEEARVWLDGLDRINNSGLVGTEPDGTTRRGILATIDLSATPFYLAGSGFPEGAPFPWLVSDFGLVDAIESGIVKIPRIPVKQVMPGESPDEAAGRPDPEYFRLWDHMAARMGPSDRTSRSGFKPESLYRHAEGALTTLYSQWQQRFAQYREAVANRVSEIVPPAMIVVCADTGAAEHFYEMISGERKVGEGKDATTVYGSSNFPELCNEPGVLRTFRIDSALLASLSSDEDASKDERVSRMREIIDTIGKPGRPGEHVRCIVSVSMLTEGWDANNVTQILGIRPFRSQLLCEQVVGRGLRRRSYATRKVQVGERMEDRLEPEYVDVYGIPFSLIPFKGADTSSQSEDRPTNHIHPVPEKDFLAIDVPRVENFTYELLDAGIRCDVDSLPELVLDSMPAAVDVEAVRGYKDQEASHRGVEQDMERQTRAAYYANVHIQRVEMIIAQRVTQRLMDGQKSRRPEDRTALTAGLFAEVFSIARRYIHSRVRVLPGQDIRDLGFLINMDRAVEALAVGIQTGFSGGQAAKILPIVNRMRPMLRSADVEEHTKRPVRLIEKSHLNAIAPRSSVETQVARALDWSDHVEAWVPNARGFDLRLEYEHDGKDRLYEPDYVVRLKAADGSRKHLIIEVKGAGGEIWDEQSVRAKEIVARRWCTAVTNAGVWGSWSYEIVREADLLDDVLARHAGVVTPPLPYRIVEVRKSERWKTCVPRVPLAVAAGGFSEEQESLFGEEAMAWIVWDGMPAPELGMFVARISGDSMEPQIPAGSWCLFRQPRAGSRDGRLLVVQHASVSEAGFPVGLTLKRYRSEKVIDPETGELRHTRISLEPLNPSYQPIELAESEGDEGTGQVRVIGEFVSVIG